MVNNWVSIGLDHAQFIIFSFTDSLGCRTNKVLSDVEIYEDLSEFVIPVSSTYKIIDIEWRTNGGVGGFERGNWCAVYGSYRTLYTNKVKISYCGTYKWTESDYSRNFGIGLEISKWLGGGTLLRMALTKGWPRGGNDHGVTCVRYLWRTEDDPRITL